MATSNYTTPRFTISYPHLLEGQVWANKPDAKPSYNCVAIFAPGTDLEPMKKLVKEALAEKWPDVKKRPQGLRNPIRKNEERWLEGEDGKTIPAAGYPAGGHFVALKSNEKPKCVDQSVKLITDSSQLYAGAVAIAVVRFYAYDFQGNRGISCGLQTLQVVADGPRLDNRVRPEDAFKPAPELAGGDTGAVFDDSEDALS